MKKKIKDLTLKECKLICSKTECPCVLENVCTDYCNLPEKELNQEIEVNEDE